jgi:hypothetical protein
MKMLPSFSIPQTRQTQREKHLLNMILQLSYGFRLSHKELPTPFLYRLYEKTEKKLVSFLG